MELNSKKRLLVFASGSGSNAENLVHFFRNPENISLAEVVGIICNNSQAGVIKRAEKLNIPCELVSKVQWGDLNFMRDLILSFKPQLVILAGFLKQFPKELIETVEGKIINLHPALLPKFGGKGMFGMNVHRAVIDSGELTSGITIHWVNEHYDEGNIIAQFTCNVTTEDNPESLAAKIHDLEFHNFPRIVKQVIQDLEQ